MRRQSKAQPCKRRLPNNEPCGHTTHNANGDCGRHVSAASRSREGIARNIARRSAQSAALSECDDAGIKTFHLAGTLARGNKTPTEHQQVLQAALERAMNGDAWLRTMRVTAALKRHPTLSGPVNRVLVASHVAHVRGEGLVLPRKKWEELGRTIKDGCEGQMIYVPRKWTQTVAASGSDAPEETEERSGVAFLFGGRNGEARYYDISETDGPELADEEWARLASTLEGPSHEAEQEFLEDMHAAADRAGCRVVEMPAASMPASKMGHLSLEADEIVLRDDLSPAAKAAVMAHELAHRFDPSLARCQSAAERGRYYMGAREECEFVAESVAYAVCHHYGIDTSDTSAQYLFSWRPAKARRAKKLYERAQKSLDAVLGSSPTELAAA